MNRREFVRVLPGVLAVGTMEAQADGGTPTFYFVDGYHGGAKGHMPAGAWRDIVNALREIPHWKLCLDIEPESWDALLRDDPAAYYEVKRYLEATEQSPRIEMVGATFSQPYGWAVNGESNIRQLTRGLGMIRRHFPGARVETYAVQEPCWASCLPQILRSLGFRYAVLKNPGTAWGGYAAGMDAEVVPWVGPDGTAVSAVPRYACEELRKVYETESGNPTPEFSRKCVAHGIRHPVGTYLQDLGWAAKPKASGDYIQNVTWREYFERIAEPPAKAWKFGMEDILTALPWGEKTLQTVAQQERSAENRILLAEKMAAMAWLERRAAWPAAELLAAWDDLFWAQGHDPWITATTRSGRQAWAFQVGAGTLRTEEAADAIIRTAAIALGAGAKVQTEKRQKAQWVRVVNTLAAARDEVVEMSVAADRGTRSVRVFNSQGDELPCQATPVRKYAAGQATAGESWNAVSVMFRAKAPAMGSSAFRVEFADTDAVSAGESATTARRGADGSVVMENDHYRVRIDAARGGAITGLFAKKIGKEFCDAAAERTLNEYRGYFIAQKAWRSSTEHPATVTVMEAGPMRARVRVAGQVGGVPFQSVITLTGGEPCIDFQVRFTYEQETWIGDPWDIKPEDRRSEPRRSSNDGRSKLQAFFPVALHNRAVYKNAAYDVCKSRNENTFFQRWDEIKHNIIVNWVDVFDEREKLGLAVLSDHTTAYTHGPEHDLALVLGWGWEGGFWWGKRPLQGATQIRYALLPHRGLWDEAGVSAATARWQEALVPCLMDGAPADSGPRSLIRVDGEGLEIPTVVVDGDRALVRLFNAAGSEAEFGVSFLMEARKVELVELDGRTIRELAVGRGSDGRDTVRLAMPRFGIRTLRCEFS